MLVAGTCADLFTIIVLVAGTCTDLFTIIVLVSGTCTDLFTLSVLVAGASFCVKGLPLTCWPCFQCSAF